MDCAPLTLLDMSWRPQCISCPLAFAVNCGIHWVPYIADYFSPYVVHYVRGQFWILDFKGPKKCDKWKRMWWCHPGDLCSLNLILLLLLFFFCYTSFLNKISGQDQGVQNLKGASWPSADQERGSLEGWRSHPAACCPRMLHHQEPAGGWLSAPGPHEGYGRTPAAGVHKYVNMCGCTQSGPSLYRGSGFFRLLQSIVFFLFFFF